jgi:arylsulfatase A-like enzyme
VDLYPTLLDLCGLEGEPALDGHSLTPLLANPAGNDWPHLTLTTFGPGNHAIHGKEWTSIHYADGTEEWYERTKDPHQWWNRVGEDTPSPLMTRHRRTASRFQASHRGGSSAGLEAWEQAEAISQ